MIVKKTKVRTVNIANRDNFFYVLLWEDSFSKSRVFGTLVSAQKHAKRLLKKEGTILAKESLALD